MCSVTSSRQRLPVTSSFTLVTPQRFVRNVFTPNYAYVLQGESLDLKRRTLDTGDCKRRTLDTGDYKHRTLDTGDCKHDLELVRIVNSDCFWPLRN